MKLIVGLGNPEPKFKHNRHNVGFMMVDFWVQKAGHNIKFSQNNKFNSLVTELEFNHEKLLFLKPQTYMNSSGMAVQKAMQFYKIKIQDLIVIHDDLDIDFGQFKIQIAKGPKIHNGLNSIIAQLKSQDFYRIRIGIAGETYRLIKKQGKSIAEEYVLQDFISTEKEQLPQIFERIYTEAKDLV